MLLNAEVYACGAVPNSQRQTRGTSEYDKFLEFGCRDEDQIIGVFEPSIRMFTDVCTSPADYGRSPMMTALAVMSGAEMWGLDPIVASMIMGPET